MIEFGFRERTDFRPDRAGADYVLNHSIERSDDHAVVVRIGDEQPVAFLISQHFARIRQKAGRRGEFFELETYRLFIEFVPRAEISDHLPDDVIEHIENAFARMRTDDLALRVDQD